MNNATNNAARRTALAISQADEYRDAAREVRREMFPDTFAGEQRFLLVHSAKIAVTDGIYQVARAALQHDIDNQGVARRHLAACRARAATAETTLAGLGWIL